MLAQARMRRSAVVRGTHSPKPVRRHTAVTAPTCCLTPAATSLVFPSPPILALSRHCLEPVYFRHRNQLKKPITLCSLA